MAVKTFQGRQMRSLRAFAFTPSITPWYSRNGGTGRVATIATYKVPKVENENNVGTLGYKG